MNKQFFKGLATAVFVVSVPLQSFAVGGIGKQMQMRVNSIDKALSLDAMTKALDDLKQDRRSDQTLNAKNRKHLLNYIKKSKYHPTDNHKAVLKFDNERKIAKVFDASLEELKVKNPTEDEINRFLDLTAGHITNYKKPIEKKKLRKNIGAVKSSRSYEAKKSIKTDPTVDKWRTNKDKSTTGIAGKLPRATKPLNITKPSKALSVKKSAPLSDVKPLSKKAPVVDTVSRPSRYKKSAAQEYKEQEEARVKRESVRERIEARLKNIKA